MAIPLLIALHGRQPAPAGAGTLYRPGGAHRPLAAAAALAIAGGIGATLVFALVVPAIIDQPTVIIGTQIPVKPIDVPTVEPTPKQPEPTKSVITAPTPRFDVPTMTQAPDARTPTDDAPFTTYLPVPTGEGTAPTPAADPPRTPVFVAATRDPAFARRFQPSYPPALERLGVEGRCRVTVTIAAAGNVTGVADAGCDDPAFFASTQRQALRSWRFRPATRDGVAVESTQEVGVLFRVPRD